MASEAQKLRTCEEDFVCIF